MTTLAIVLAYLLVDFLIALHHGGETWDVFKPWKLYREFNQALKVKWYVGALPFLLAYTVLLAAMPWVQLKHAWSDWRER